MYAIPLIYDWVTFMQQRHDIIVSLYYNAIHHGPISYTASVIGFKLEVIPRQEEERCQTWAGKPMCEPVAAGAI